MNLSLRLMTLRPQVHTATDESDLRSPHSFTKKIERLIYIYIFFLAYRPWVFSIFFLCLHRLTYILMNQFLTAKTESFTSRALRKRWWFLVRWDSWFLQNKLAVPRFLVKSFWPQYLAAGTKSSCLYMYI